MQQTKKNPGPSLKNHTYTCRRQSTHSSCIPKYRALHFVYGGGTGSTRRVVDLCKAHQKRKLFDCYLVFRGQPFDQQIAGELQSLGIGFFCIDSASPLTIIYRLIKLIRTIRPEALFSHGYHEHIHGRLAALIAGVPFVIQVERNIERYNFFNYLLSRILSIFTQKIICVSSAVKDSLAAKGFSFRKLVVIYNGFQLERLRPPTGYEYENRKNQIIMVARFSAQKDQVSLLRALKLLVDNGQRVELLLVGDADGDGEYLKMNKDLCVELDLADSVKFLGQKKNIPELLWQSKICVLSTHYEGLSGVVIEGLVAGCAVIASDVPGVSELIEHEKTGWLVPENDPVTLAKTIEEVLSNPKYSAKIAENGRQYAEAMFDISTMADNYAKLLFEEINS
jgi:glycosyltransferase involved in cell wall biosynthesis